MAFQTSYPATAAVAHTDRTPTAATMIVTMGVTAAELFIRLSNQILI